MRKLLLLLPALFISQFFTAQNFTWMRGDNFSGAFPGTYGVQGFPSPSNDPGHRHGAATWVDASGNLWLFGGEGYAGNNTLCWLSDLWKYDPATNQWTWIRGSSGPNAIGNYGTQLVASASNEPGAREFAMSWTDSQGNFWLFGGDGFAGSSTFGRLGDLWKYNPTSNQWTWMKGFNTVDNNGIYGTLNVAAAGNLPGSRYGGGKWVDAGNNLWLFGGRGFPASGGSSFLNDLWKYDPATNQWTWMSGSMLGAQNGLYGTQAVASVTNAPGGVEFPASWVDNSGKLYLFSGRGYPLSGPAGYLSDVWKYNPATSEWTWAKGSAAVNQVGAYGTLGVSSNTTTPGGRYASASWKDLAGNLWVFGGLGFGSANAGTLNDLFKYDPLTNQFTWIKGAVNPGTNGLYGTMGVTAATNMPGGRLFNTYWRGQNGDFWLIGGEGLDASAITNKNMNDLWKFTVPCNPDSVLVSAQNNSFCTPASVSLTAYNQYPASVQWFSSPTGTQVLGTGTVFSTGALPGPQVHTFYAQSNSCTMAPRTAISVTVNGLPAIGITGNSAVCSGATASLVANGASTYTWANGPSTASYAPTPTLNTTYTVMGTDLNGCKNTGTISILFNPSPTVSIAQTATYLCHYMPPNATLTAAGAATYSWNTGSTSSSLVVSSNVSAGVYAFTVTGTDANGCKNAAVTNITVLDCAGLPEAGSPVHSIVLYPNPSRGEFIIQGGAELKTARLTIVNALGETVYTEDVKGELISVNAGLPKGLYVVTLSTDGTEMGSAKLIVE